MPAPKLTQFKDGRYCLAFYLDGKRRQETYSKLPEAQRRINEIERLKGKGVRVVVKEKVAVDDSAQDAINQLTANGITKPLSTVVDEYVAAHEALGASGSVVEASKAYANSQDKIVPITTSDLVADYERYLTGQKVSKDHLHKTIKIYLKRFAADMPSKVSEITLKNLQDWRAPFTTGPRKINNYCNAVKALFNYVPHSA